MATNIFYDSVMSTAKLADIAAEQSVETEILLADYDQPVFKIVKTTMEHSVTQKYIAKNKLVAEGFIKLCIYYQPPKTEKFAVITQRIPFQLQQELQQEASDISFIRVSGACQYVNTRPQNPTRIDVRGAYMFYIKVFGRKQDKAVTAAGGNTVCTDNVTLECFSLSGQNIRQFTVEDELDTEHTDAKIVNVCSYTPPSLVSAFQDKITAKGEIQTDFYYTTESSDGIKKYTHKFLYNQIIDMPEIKENHIAYADISVTNITVTQNPDTKKYTAAVTVQIDATAFAKQQLIAVKDAFSCRYAYGKTEKTVFTDANIYQTDKTVPLNFTAETGRDCTVNHIIFDISPAKNYFEINKTTVKSRVTAHIIAKNAQQEYECYAHSEDIVFPWLENCSQHDEIVLKLSVAGYTFSQQNGNVQVSANISVQGLVIEKRKVTLIEDFAEDTDSAAEERDEGLVLYYAQKGERVFDIAKQHRCNPKEIMEENELDTDVLQESRLIFVPVFEE